MTKTNFKQVGFLSAILISVGSTIGAGIYFKNAEIFKNTGGSLAFVIAAWMISAFGILAIGLALVETTSKNTSDSGIFESMRRFLPAKLAKYFTAYYVLVYVPTNYFLLPMYAVMSMQDALEIKLSGYSVAAIAFGFFVFFAMLGHFKFKLAEKYAWLITFIKMIPLVIIAIMALVQTGQNGVVEADAVSVSGMTGLSPWLGLMASIPAVLFAYDGFYVVTSIRSKIENKNRMGAIMVLSISSITAIYLMYSLAVGMTGAGFSSLDVIRNSKWLGKVINLLMMFSILGILNGYSLSNTSFYKSVNENEGIRLIDYTSALFRKMKIRMSYRNSALVTHFGLGFLWFVISSIIGFWIWKPNDLDYITSYGTMSAALYEVTDLIANYTTLIVFCSFGLAILGALINRKTKKNEVIKNKYFIPSAVIAIIFLLVGVTYTVISSIVNMSGINGFEQITGVVSFVFLIISLLIAILPLFFKTKLEDIDDEATEDLIIAREVEQEREQNIE